MKCQHAKLGACEETVPPDERCITPDIYGTRYYLDCPPFGRVKNPIPVMIIRESSTSLLRTYKQINTEATNILYRANTFTFAEVMHPTAANSNLESPNESRLRPRIVLYSGMNDIL